MKIHIENFGPISSFSFDLEKDLHVIYGKNNIGKSYAISVVYLMLKAVTQQREKLLELLFFIQNNNNSQFKEINKIISEAETLIHSNSESVSIKNDFEKLVSKLLVETFLSSIVISFKNTFPDFINLKNRFSKQPSKIIVHFKSFSFVMKISANNLIIDNVNLYQEYVIKTTDNKGNVQNNFKNEEVIFYLNKSSSTHQISKLKGELTQYAAALLNADFTHTLSRYNDVFFLPASRSGLYQSMSIFSSVFAKLSQLRHQIKGKIDIPALSEPMSDYFLNLSNIKVGIERDVYYNFAREIENKILNAQIEFNQENKKLEYFNKDIKLRLDLGETSSMVSEMTPIVAYLKYIINEKSELDNRRELSIFETFNHNNDNTETAKILFIEEPEAHLHPEIQVLLIEIFAKLTKHNVKIVLTTHSNYIFNKVNNLILNKDLATEKIASYHIIHTEKGSIVKEENKLTEEGMEDENFVPIAEQLYKERLDIYENQN